MNFQIIFFTLGVLLLTLGFALVFPFMLDYVEGAQNAEAFGWSALIAIFFGGGLCISNTSFKRELTIKQAFFLTTMSWLLICGFAAIPMCISDLQLSYTDAFFESVSGFTTTGSTVLSGLDTMSRGIILWRAILQWIGGLGIIAFAMILLPFLNIGGMQLFRAESSDKSDKIMPKTIDIVWSILYVYIILTVACTLTYHFLGMGKFDAMVHAMATLPTGGFSSHDSSFGHFNSYALDMAGTFFMLMGGLPFILFVKLFYQGKFDFFKDVQVKTLLFILGLTIGLTTLYLWVNDYHTLANSFRFAAFNIVSVITTTGFATTDYLAWGPFAIALFLFITYIGCCAGSTSGGIKMLRINIAFQALNHHMKTLIFPNGVFTSTYQKKPLTNDVINTVMGFLFLYVLTNVVITIALSFTGLDFMTSLSGAATAIGNVGPGATNLIGPVGNFTTLNDPAKWILSIGMLLGRLEIMTVLVLFMPSFWRN
jgi:trk system potassium uptake protein TrkH